MFGFNIVTGKVSQPKSGDINYKGMTCQNLMISRFSDDKVFVENESYILILDGVVTNKKDLLGGGRKPMARKVA